jgi:hypothetical protein
MPSRRRSYREVPWFLNAASSQGGFIPSLSSLTPPTAGVARTPGQTRRLRFAMPHLVRTGVDADRTECSRRHIRWLPPSRQRQAPYDVRLTGTGPPQQSTATVSTYVLCTYVPDSPRSACHQPPRAASRQWRAWLDPSEWISVPSPVGPSPDAAPEAVWSPA